MKHLVAAALLIGSMFGSGAGAATLLDTGLPDQNRGLRTVSPAQSLAARLTFGADTIIESVQGYFFATSPRSVTVALHGESGGLPGGVLFSRTVSVPAFNRSPQEVGGLSWAVGPGRYWLSFAAAAEIGMSGFAPNGVGLANEAFTANGLWRAGESEQGLALRIIGQQAAAVPEPASWALMIGGFALVGGAVRRSRRAAVVAV